MTRLFLDGFDLPTSIYGAAIQRAIGDRLNDEEAGILAVLLGKLYRSGCEDG